MEDKRVLVRVDITADDIQEGIRRDGAYDPLGRALRRVLNQGIHAQAASYDLIVFRVPSRWSIAKSGIVGSVEVCESMQAWLRDFDNGVAVAPISIAVRVWRSWLKHPEAVEIPNSAATISKAA